MSYKYKSVRQLVRLIDTGQAEDGINIKKAIEVYNESLLKSPTRRYSTSWKPRYYNRAMTMNTRSKKLGTGEKITWQELEQIHTNHNGRCIECKSTSHIVFDHIVSYFNGGKNIFNNIQLLCRRCNTIKGVN